MEADLLNQLRNVKLDDRDGHTRLVMALQINHAVARQLRMVIQDGERAVHELSLRGKRID